MWHTCTESCVSRIRSGRHRRTLASRRHRLLALHCRTGYSRGNVRIQRDGGDGCSVRRRRTRGGAWVGTCSAGRRSASRRQFDAASRHQHAFRTVATVHYQRSPWWVYRYAFMICVFRQHMFYSKIRLLKHMQLVAFAISIYAHDHQWQCNVVCVKPCSHFAWTVGFAVCCCGVLRRLNLLLSDEVMHATQCATKLWSNNENLARTRSQITSVPQCICMHRLKSSQNDTEQETYN